MTELSSHIGDIARQLLGEPNKTLSTRAQLRFGSNGSIAVEISGSKVGTWYDHENKVGGGAWDLLHLKGGLADADIPSWIERELGIGLQRPANGHAPSIKPRIVATYDYTDESGELLFQVCRLHPKTFRQRRPDGNGGWDWSTKGVPPVPYRLPELAAAAAKANGSPWRVYIVEGEKDADALVTRWGLTASTNRGGAGKWRPEYNRYFAGADAVVIPDNDDAGRTHAQAVAANLLPVATSVRVLDLTGLPDKADISDWIQGGGTQSDFDTLVELSHPFQPDEGDIEDETAGPSGRSALEVIGGNAAVEIAIHDAGAKGTDKLRLVHFEDMRPHLGDSYLVKHLLGSAAMAVLYGESGTGKTFLALHIGLSIAAGINLFGRRVRRAGVIYVAAEAGRGIENRVAAYKHEIEFPETMPFAAITTPVDLCSDEADLQRLVDAVMTAQLGIPIGLIIVDTLSRVMGGGNENQPDDMGNFVKNIDLLRARTNAAVIIVHHSGKDASRGARGHSLLRAATDTEIEVTRDEATKTSTARVTKQREYQTDGAFSFTLTPVDLGDDEEGDPVGSCIVQEVECAAIPKPKTKALSATEGRALQLLAEAIDKAGETPPANNHIPASTRCVSEELWRKYCYQGAISRGGQNAKRMAFNRSGEALIAANRIGKWAPWVWLT